jgi:hypothetical protein
MINWIFCIGSLVASLAIAALLYPFAALPTDEVAMASEPQPAEALGMVEIGSGFGSRPVVELMDYYMTNPPVRTADEPVSAPQIHFGGC